MNWLADGRTPATGTNAEDAEHRLPLVETDLFAPTRPADQSEILVSRRTTGKNGEIGSPVTDEAIRVERRVERITGTVRREAVFIEEAATAVAEFARSPTTTRSSDQGSAPKP